MPEILLTPELLRSKANELNITKNLLTEQIDKIQSFVDRLQEGWHGKAQQAFANSFLEKKAVFVQFVEDIGGFIAFMQGYANTMEQADANAPSGLNF